MHLRCSGAGSEIVDPVQQSRGRPGGGEKEGLPEVYDYEIAWMMIWSQIQMDIRIANYRA